MFSELTLKPVHVMMCLPAGRKHSRETASRTHHHIRRCIWLVVSALASNKIPDLSRCPI